MFDLKLNGDGDLHIGPEGDVATTDSIVQAVSIRLKWFQSEWRLGPDYGFPYYEEVFVKNPNITKIKYLLRDLVADVEGVTGVTTTEVEYDPKARSAKFSVTFTVGEETYHEEVEING